MITDMPGGSEMVGASADDGGVSGVARSDWRGVRMGVGVLASSREASVSDGTDTPVVAIGMGESLFPLFIFPPRVFNRPINPPPGVVGTDGVLSAFGGLPKLEKSSGILGTAAAVCLFGFNPK
jgi:hypothetical protein